MTKKIITIIIPAYNEEESLPKCLERVTKLIDKEKAYNFEVLLVDDGSKDRRSILLRKSAKKINVSTM